MKQKVQETLMPRKWPALLSTIVALVVFSPTAPAQASGTLIVNFSNDWVSPAPEDMQHIAKYAKHAAESGMAIVIKDAGFGLGSKSRPAFKVRTQSLKIFKLLVDNGFPAERIRIKSPSNKPASNTVELTLEMFNPQAEMTDDVSVDAFDPSVSFSHIYFHKNSAIPLLDADLTPRLIATLRQADIESISIVGFTDIDGDRDYNDALSELRALTVYKLLVNSGVAPTSMTIAGQGVASHIQAGTEKRNKRAEQRHVHIRWARKTTPKLDAQLPPEPRPEVVNEGVAAETDKEKDNTNVGHEALTFRYALDSFAGALIPLGELSEHANSAIAYGIGLGLIFEFDSLSAVRTRLASTGQSKLGAKESDRDGALNIRIVSLTGDYLLSLGSLTLFVGAGLDRHLWNATIVQPSTERSNTGGRSDNGIQLRTGLSFAVSQSLSLGPQLSFHKASGDLNEDFLVAVIALHGEI